MIFETIFTKLKNKDNRSISKSLLTKFTNLKADTTSIAYGTSKDVKRCAVDLKSTIFLILNSLA